MSLPVRRPRNLQTLQFVGFWADLNARELRRNGVRVRLQKQPFSVLAVLLEHAGDVVTREELRQRLWPSDTFVGFDNSLNTAINKIREALGDSAEDPHFVETLPRRGYRFIAPVYGQNSQDQTESSLSMLRSFRMWIGAGLVTLVILAGVGAIAVSLSHPISQPRILGWKQITNDGLPKVGLLVTDGTRIYFGENSSGRNILSQVSIAGGESESIETTVEDPVIEDFSPEDSQLLVQASKDQWNPEGSDFWLVPVPKGPSRRMEGVVGRAGGWVPIPSGNFYFSKGKDLYIANHDGSNPHRITTAAGQIVAIRSSPDGSRFRFTFSDLGKYSYSLWEVRFDGSGLHPVLPGWNDPPRECCGSWTPNGRYYFFQAVQHDIGSIWVMREQSGLFRKASSQPMQLAAGPMSYSSMAFGKDAKQLFAIGELRRAELVAYDKKSQNFVPFLGGIPAGDLDFSRDGQWVAYVTYPDGLLWRSRLDGSERLQLTFPPMHAALVHWSPDGKQIAFSEITPGKSWRISLISRDGDAPQQLTSTELVEVDPNWSPDGTTLAYGVYLPGRPDRSSLRFLDLKTRRSSQIPGSEGVCFPRWSPDGRYLVAIPFDAQKLALFDFQTNKWRELVSQVGTIDYFCWSSDSLSVYFDNSFTPDPAYLRVRISDSKLDRIASLKPVRRYISDFGIPWSGLGPGEIPLFVRDISTQEIYALDWQLP
jgi:Tol biopolymer transport system component/DNA-binding winged helix-turn-helix (wHTH) protein